MKTRSRREAFTSCGTAQILAERGRMFAVPPGLHLLLSSGQQPHVDVICVCGRNWCFPRRWKMSVLASCAALGASLPSRWGLRCGSFSSAEPRSVPKSCHPSAVSPLNLLLQSSSPSTEPKSQDFRSNRARARAFPPRVGSIGSFLFMYLNHEAP